MAAITAADDEDEAVVKDANGTVLKNGDAVVLIKDLKVKGSSTTLKMGTKVKSTTCSKHATCVRPNPPRVVTTPDLGST